MITTLNAYAALTPIAIKVNMLRLRNISERNALSKNGQPAQSTTGVLKAN